MTDPFRRVRLRGSPFAPARRFVLGANSLRHNETPLVSYPERDWNIVAFPMQKGPPHAADNLATVNSHAFLEDARFVAAAQEASARWTESARDIRWRLHTFVWAVDTALRMHSTGDLIELGTGRGYMAAGACKWLGWGSNALTLGRHFWLMDRSSVNHPMDLPAPTPRSFFYADGDEDVRNYFNRYEGVRVVTGLLPDALDEITVFSLAFVHVDLNDAQSEVASLDRLAHRLLPGAIVLFDDSGNPGRGEQLRVHREWSAGRGAPFLELPTGQGLCVVP